MIPNHFHFIFGLREQNEPFHLMYYLCLRSCINVNQPDAVFFHYQNEPWGPWWDLIKPDLELRKVEPNAFVTDFSYADPSISAFRYAHHADFLRLEILLREGGIYADIDTLFLKPLPKDWFGRPFILGQEKPPPGATHSLCNAWIASEPGSAFCRRWLDGLQDAFDGTWSNHSTLLPHRLAQHYPDDITIEPEASLYALDYSPEGIADLFCRSVQLPESAYSLHLWNHLWFAKDRRDFSDFHAGLLTTNYVQYANTTYAKHARAHLPHDNGASQLAYKAEQLAFCLDASPRQAMRRVRHWLRGPRQA